jgi:cation:H+ antiporter
LEGIILVGILVIINYYFFKKLNDSSALEMIEEVIVPIPIWKSIVLLLGGIFGLYFGADLFVDSAVEIATIVGISQRVIGITVIAIGTSIPEMITSIIAAINKKTDIAIGNILGSNIMNVLAIIGTTALISPIQVSEIFLKQDFYWMLGLTILLFPIFKTKDTISRIEGLILFGIYCTYIFMII